jgi:hypothetical protein
MVSMPISYDFIAVFNSTAPLFSKATPYVPSGLEDEQADKMKRDRRVANNLFIVFFLKNKAN